MIIKTGLEVYVHDPVMVPDKEPMRFANSLTNSPMKVSISSHVIWVIDFKDEFGKVVHTILSSTEPRAKIRERSLLLTRESGFAEERWKYETETYGIPEDARISVHPDEWSDTERRVAHWWEVEL